MQATDTKELPKRTRYEYMTLLMRDRVNIEKGRIYGAISVYRDLNLSDSEILKKMPLPLAWLVKPHGKGRIGAFHVQKEIPKEMLPWQFRPQMNI